METKNENWIIALIGFGIIILFNSGCRKDTMKKFRENYIISV